MSFWKALFGQTSGAEPYFINRSDAEVERLLLESIRSSTGRALNLGNGIVHGMRIPWEQAHRVIESLKTKGLVDYEIPHNTWIKAAHA